MRRWFVAALALVTAMGVAVPDRVRASADGEWIELLAEGPSHFAGGHSTIYDVRHDRLVSHGGMLCSVPIWLESTVVFDLDPVSRSSVTTAPPRTNSLTVYDPGSDRMILFGGDGSLPRNETWIYDLSGVRGWKRFFTPGALPAQRAAHKGIFDPLRYRVIVDGGSDAPFSELGDTWALDLPSATWSQILPAGPAPAPRSGHAAIYDPVRDRMIVFLQASGEVRALALSGTPTWSRLLPSGVIPDASPVHGAIYDPVRDRMVLYSNSRVWALALSGPLEWTQLQPVNLSPNGLDFAVAYDLKRNRMLVHATSCQEGGGGLWALQWDGVYQGPLSVAPGDGALALRAPRPNPSGGRASIAFSLPDARPARFDLFDPQGRRLETRVVSGAGEHAIELGTSVSLSAGIYLIRLAHGGRAVHRKLAVID